MKLTFFALQVMAQTVRGEAGGESDDAMRNVARVLFARGKRPSRFGAMYAIVCLDKDQFSCWNHNDPNFLRIFELEAWELTREISAILAVYRDPTGPDPTQGACHYLAKSLPQERWPRWAFLKDHADNVDRTRPRTIVHDDGAHLFFNDVP